MIRDSIVKRILRFALWDRHDHPDVLMFAEAAVHAVSHVICDRTVRTHSLQDQQSIVAEQECFHCIAMTSSERAFTHVGHGPSVRDVVVRSFHDRIWQDRMPV